MKPSTVDESTHQIAPPRNHDAPPGDNLPAQTSADAGTARAWLASLVLSRPERFLSRLALGLSRLRAMPRGWRRQLRRRAAATVAGAALILAMAGSALIAPPVHAAGITVDTSIGDVVDDGQCSLREAILNANGNNRQFNSPGECAKGSSADTIYLGSDVTLTDGYGDTSDDYGDTALPAVTSKIIIEGNGHTIAVVGADTIQRLRVLLILENGDLELNNVTITGGVEELGANILSGGDLTLRQSTVTDGYAMLGGGIAHGAGELNIVNSLISNNEATYSGGGILTADPGGFNLENSVIKNNTALLYSGGGIAAYGPGEWNLAYSEISDNSAGFSGGGIATVGSYGESFINITNGSVITRNHTNNQGGGIYNNCTEITLEDSEITENSAIYEYTPPVPTAEGLTITGGFRGAADPEIVAKWKAKVDSPDGRSFSERLSNIVGVNDVTPQEVLGGFGGGVYNTCYGTFRAIDSTISGNRAGWGGGAIANQEYSKVYIENSVIRYNNGGYYGGGMTTIGHTEVSDSTIDNNYAEQGGGLLQGYGVLLVTNSTISNNDATVSDGGGILTHCGVTDIRNSTISGNSALVGGGIHLLYPHLFACDEDYRSMTLRFNTVTGNTATDSGGGISRGYGYGKAPELELVGNIVSGNTATDLSGVDNVVTGYDYGLVTESNLFGENNMAGISGFTPSSSDIVPGVGVYLTDILNPTLGNNGGPTLTHLLVAGSPALDVETCEEPAEPETDQRGAPRNQDGDSLPSDNECDIGAVEGTEYFEAPPPPDPAVFMSATQAGTTADGQTFDNSDILKWDGEEWSLAFDGSAALLAPKKSKHNTNAFWIGDDEIIMAFAQNGRKVPGIEPKVDGADLVRWDGTAFSLWFDGSDVGLTKKGPEKIDGLHVLVGEEIPAEFNNGCVAFLLVSTQGPGAVPNYPTGQIKISGEDVLGFCMTNAGQATAGFWHLLVDGSAEGVKKNATDSISLSADGGTLYLTSKGAFDVDAASGSHSMVYAYDLDTGKFSGPLFIAEDNGLSQKVDGLQMD